MLYDKKLPSLKDKILEQSEDSEKVVKKDKKGKKLKKVVLVKEKLTKKKYGKSTKK